MRAAPSSADTFAVRARSEARGRPHTADGGTPGRTQISPSSPSMRMMPVVLLRRNTTPTAQPTLRFHALWLPHNQNPNSTARAAPSFSHIITFTRCIPRPRGATPRPHHRRCLRPTSDLRSSRPTVPAAPVPTAPEMTDCSCGMLPCPCRVRNPPCAVCSNVAHLPSTVWLNTRADLPTSRRAPEPCCAATHSSPHP